MPLPHILYISPSRVESDWRCPRARWWGHEYDGVGLEPTSSVTELIFGNIAHEGLARLAGGNPHPTPISEVATQAWARARSELGPPAGATRSIELAALLQGQLFAFHSRIWPRLLTDYDVVSVEREFELLLFESDDYKVIFRCRPDLIIRRRDNGTLWYLEYKTTSTVSPKWIQSWSKAVQLHVGCRAAALALGEPVVGCIVQGIYKGYEKDDRINSPFTYGWKKEGVPGVLRPQFSYTYTPRWSRFFVPSEMEMDAWVSGMPDELLAEQFPQTPPIFPRDGLIDAFIRQRIAREEDVYAAFKCLQDAKTPAGRQAILDTYYPQKFNQCSPAWGSPCSFLQACWNPWIGQDPTASGYYVMRQYRNVTSPLAPTGGSVNIDRAMPSESTVSYVGGHEGSATVEEEKPH